MRKVTAMRHRRDMLDVRFSYRPTNSQFVSVFDTPVGIAHRSQRARLSVTRHQRDVSSLASKTKTTLVGR
jgi:hypothetical protein